MNILIICTFYPPDSSVSAVRPYMLAKYLSRRGHKVTVLRSGAFNNAPDDSLPELEDVEVISFLGSESDAEKYKNGCFAPRKCNTSARKADRLPEPLRKVLVHGYFIATEPFSAEKRIHTAKRMFELQKKTLDSMSHLSFDAVFSTYSNLENIYAGEYAAKIFNALWIQDFRDPVVIFSRKESFFWNIFAKRIQLKALSKADLCTAVSDGVKNYLKLQCPSAKIQTLYNGYDLESDKSTNCHENDQSSKFTICYTGLLYEMREEGLHHLLSCIKELSDEGIMDLSRLCFEYAGPNSAGVQRAFSKYELLGILRDHGYVTRDEAKTIQDNSDIFLVLSWNTKSSQGVLTGKFYEGIRANKPILSIVTGNLPMSELFLFNEQYSYGYCYETCRSLELHQGMKLFLQNAYEQKLNNGCINYTSSEKLITAFQYDHIAKSLEDYILHLR